MRLCLDTNAYTLLQRGHEPLITLFENADEILLPTVVIGELFSGFALGAKSAANKKLLRKFLEVPGVSIAEINFDVAERYGLLVAELRSRGTPLPTNDIWIAATTLSIGARLITYDKHFDKISGLITDAP